MPTITLQKIGANIRRHRQAKQIKQEYLAIKVGLCKSAISRLENGLRDTSLKRLLKVAEILEIDPVKLFDE